MKVAQRIISAMTILFVVWCGMCYCTSQMKPSVEQQQTDFERNFAKYRVYKKVTGNPHKLTFEEWLVMDKEK